MDLGTDVVFVHFVCSALGYFLHVIMLCYFTLSLYFLQHLQLILLVQSLITNQIVL